VLDDRLASKIVRTVAAKRLLIIDDEVGLTKVVGLIAGQLGMEFRALNTSPSATEVFIDFRPDVVIIDVIMPDKGGIDVLNEIMLTGIPTRVVLTSGYSEPYLPLAESLAKSHGDERIRFLMKPFRRTELIELLQNIAETPPSSAADPGDS
jgi:DNA-binding NtrC family response regulator